MPPLENENNLSQDATDNTGSRFSPSGRHQDLPFYFFCTDRYSIHLFNLMKGPPTSSVVCNDVLRQVIPHRLSYLQNFERINMIEQIPELGLIIIASQVGRVALLTTTESRDSPHTAMSVGLKIERILPSKSQEDAGVRPDVPLMGIAVGPVQGYGIEVEAAGAESPAREDLDVPKLGDGRYRLLMVYCDHTVLSYELGRSKTGTGYEVTDRVLLI